MNLLLIALNKHQSTTDYVVQGSRDGSTKKHTNKDRVNFIKYKGHPYLSHSSSQINFCSIANKGSVISKEVCRFIDNYG